MKTTLIYAHPYPDRSRVNRYLLNKVRELPDLEVRDLYRLYPDFGIDAEVEQEALARADLIVWQGPMYWYTVPSLLKHWFEKVLAMGWAYGPGGEALKGKNCLWSVTTGAPWTAFARDGFHAFTMDEFTPVIQQTAQFCGMKWLPPFIVHGAHRLTDEELDKLGNEYRERILTAGNEGQGTGNRA
jgi:glutathione-regulated potassium-efflux system ancillary protein KefF